MNLKLFWIGIYLVARHINSTENAKSKPFDFATIINKSLMILGCACFIAKAYHYLEMWQETFFYVCDVW